MKPVTTPSPTTAGSATRSRLGDGVAFWLVAYAFLVALAFTTIPTPLWRLYQERDGYSSLTITVIFATYAVGVAISLFFAGHLSDWYGRRPVLIVALLLNVVAGVIFVVWSDLTGLEVARVLTGLGSGIASPTATAWLAELHSRHRPGTGTRRGQVVATAANLGGLGVGALVSGVLAQWVDHPLELPYLVFIVALLVGVGACLASPETREAPVPRPRYRPQRVSVPRAARGRFFGACVTAMISFAAFALFAALGTSFLSQLLHHPSLALAGATVFGIFAAAVIAQTVTVRQSPRQLLAGGIAAMVAGLALVVTAVWLPTPSLALFLTGGLVTGTGSGLLFKGAVGTVMELATDDNRAEALAGLFLAGYTGLTIPVVGLGVLTQVVSGRLGLALFAAALVACTAAAAPTLLGRRAAACS